MIVMLWAVVLLAPSKVLSPGGLEKTIQEVSNRTEDLVASLQRMRLMHSEVPPLGVQNMTRASNAKLAARVSSLENEIEGNDRELSHLE